MQIIKWESLDNKQQEKLFKNDNIEDLKLFDTVNTILKEIKRDGVKAVSKYELKFSNNKNTNFKLSSEEIYKGNDISEDKKDAIKQAYKNIYKFAKAQIPKKIKIKNKEKTLVKKYIPIENVGLYIPGGTAPLVSTVLMNAIPSLIAGNKNVSLFTPTKNDEPINPCILFAASLCNIKNIYRVGGVQAIGMMGFGNEQFNKVDKIFGPGNMYVAEAKKQILSTFGECNIDMPAGPSEVLVVADEFADADFVASDLLAQLEHDIEAKGILITINDNFVNKVIKSIEKQKINLSRKQIIKTAMVKNLIFITTNSLENAIKISNKFSPEHLIIQTNKNKELTALVQNAGSVFIGKYSSEALGDYISGTNHVLPTSGWAKSFGGLSVESFMKPITYQKIKQKGIISMENGLKILADIEGLDAHKNSVMIRTEKIRKEKENE